MGRGTEAGPVPTTENTYNRPADGSREVHRPCVVAHVETRGVKECSEDRHFTVAAESERGSRATESNGFTGNGFENRSLRGVAK